MPVLFLDFPGRSKRKIMAGSKENLKDKLRLPHLAQRWSHRRCFPTWRFWTNASPMTSQLCWRIARRQLVVRVTSPAVRWRHDSRWRHSAAPAWRRAAPVSCQHSRCGYVSTGGTVGSRRCSRCAEPTQNAQDSLSNCHWNYPVLMSTNDKPKRTI